MKCNHCGTEIPPKAPECPHCHMPAPALPEETPPDYAAQTVMIKDLPLAKPETPPVQEPEQPPSFAAQTVMMKDLPLAQPEIPVYAAPTTTPSTSALPMSPPSAPPAKKKMNPALIIGIVLAALVLCCLITVVAVVLSNPDWLPFEVPKLSGGKTGKQSSDYIVGTMQRDDALDLTWVHGKNEDALYSDLMMDSNYNGISYIVDGRVQKYMWSAVDFLPTDPGKLLLRVMDDDETVVKILDLKKEAEVEIFKSSSAFTGYLLQNGTFVFIESRGDSNRAYVSDGKTGAERVLKADEIYFQTALNQFLALDYDRDESTYHLYSLDGTEEVSLYQGETLRSHIISADGSLIALLKSGKDGDEVWMVNARTGEVISTNNTYGNVVELGAAPQGSLMYLFGEDEDGFLNLEATTNGTWVTLAQSANQLAVVANLDTSRMAYVLTDEEETSTLFVTDVKTAESQEILQSEDILNLLSETNLSDTFFVSEVDDDETILYRCSFRGGDPEVLIEDSEAGVSYITGINGTVFISLYAADDNTNSIWIIPEKAEEAYPLVEDWYSLYVAAVSPDGLQLVLQGAEDAEDDSGLYVIEAEENADLIKIDDDFDAVLEIDYTSDGDGLLYNVQTGENYDDYEVRRVALKSKDMEIETLYEEARIVAKGWLSFDYNQYWYAFTVYPTQSSRVSRLSVGQNASGSINQ